MIIIMLGAQRDREKGTVAGLISEKNKMATNFNRRYFLERI